MIVFYYFVIFVIQLLIHTVLAWVSLYLREIGFVMTALSVELSISLGKGTMIVTMKLYCQQLRNTLLSLIWYKTQIAVWSTEQLQESFQIQISCHLLLPLIGETMLHRE